LIEAANKPKGSEAQGISYTDASNERNPSTLRSQLKFKDKIDNSNTPWVPIIKSKPNAIRPLSTTVSESMQSHMDSLSQINTGHPYEYEIQNIVYPKNMFVHFKEILYQPINGTTLTWVDKLEKLSTL
jgi:exosome complex exonuclease RRP6